MTAVGWDLVNLSTLCPAPAGHCCPGPNRRCSSADLLLREWLVKVQVKRTLGGGKTVESLSSPNIPQLGCLPVASCHIVIVALEAYELDTLVIQPLVLLTGCSMVQHDIACCEPQGQKLVTIAHGACLFLQKVQTRCPVIPLLALRPQNCKFLAVISTLVYHRLSGAEGISLYMADGLISSA